MVFWVIGIFAECLSTFSKASITVGSSDKKVLFYLSLQRLSFWVLEHNEQKVEKKNKLPHKCRRRKILQIPHYATHFFSALRTHDWYKQDRITHTADSLWTHQGHIWKGMYSTTNCFGKENSTEGYTYKDSTLIVGQVKLSPELRQA